MSYLYKVSFSFLCFVSVCVLFFSSAEAETSTLLSGEELSQEQVKLLADEPSQASNSVIDFETYQRNIDDIFHIALMQSPNMDYGVNNIIVDLNRKIAANPKNADSLIALAHTYRIIGQPGEANRFYEKAVKVDPENFHLNVFSAMTSFEKKDFESALLRLKKAIELNPLDEYSLMTAGRIHMMLQNDEAAVESFQKVLELNPDDRQAAFMLSLIYQDMGKTEEAFELLNELKKKKPDDLFIGYHLGALYLAEAQPKKALEYWQQLFNEGVRDPQFIFSLSIAYLESGEAQKAEKIVEHLSFFFPREHDVDLLMAEVYRQLDRLDEAASRYRLILAENPNYLSARMGLAHVLKLQGKNKESKRILKQASKQGLEPSEFNQRPLKLQEIPKAPE